MKERESKYVYPGTDVLINIPGIRDPEELQRYERIVTGERLAQLKLEPIKGSFDLEHLKEIHRYLFQDIYPFAGQIRDENIGKDFFSFAQVQFIEPAAQELFQQLKNENFLKGSSFDQFAERAAHYMAEINVLHPFREGNGRTTREFIRQLGQVAGYELDWSKVDPERLLRASIRSTVDTKELANVIRDVARPLTTKELFRQREEYTPERQQLHQNIVKQILDTVQPAIEKPLATYLGGGSGAGKTSIAQMLIQVYKDNKEDVLVIDSDKIKTMLPEYQGLIKRDPENMANILHDESSDIANQLYLAALQKRVNLIYDGTMKNADKYEQMILAAKDQEYATSIVIADVPVHVAYERADIRFEVEKRRVPDHVIAESHQKIPESFKRLEPQVDQVYLYDTFKLPYQFYVRVNNQVLVNNQERLAQFFDKAKPLLVKDLIKQVDGLPAGKSGMQLDPGTLNQEVLRYRVHKLENGSKLLRIKLKTEKSLEIQMDPAPCLPKEIKGQWIERAAKGIGPKLDRQMGLDFTK